MRLDLRKVRSWLSGVIGCLAVSPGAAQGDGAIRYEEHVAETADGESYRGRIGRIRVPENRAERGGKTIEVAFAVYPSRSEKPGPPVFFLAGGPGAPGIDLGLKRATEPRLALLDHHDVVAIDQRGTGRCVPNLSNGPRFEYSVPMDRPATRATLRAAYTEAVKRCVAHWTEQGVDLRAYNTRESADDVEAIRNALGFEKIILWGTSYGSHLGLAYLRKHSAHVAAALLERVEGPNHTFKLPSTVQRCLEQLDARVAKDPKFAGSFPDGLIGELKKVLAKLKEEPVEVVLKRGTREFRATIGPLDVQASLSMALGHASTTTGVPMAVHLMTQGEFRHVLGFVARFRRGEVGSAMALAMDCASGASPARLARIDRERVDPANVLGDAIHAPYYPATCAPCGKSRLGAEFRDGLECDVPTLFVSGAIDARTPPENVEEIRDGFSRAVHVVVGETGHDSRELESEEYRALLAAFLRGEAVSDTTIELKPLPLRPLRR